MAKEELDAVSDLRYAWKKLRKCASEASDQLAALQARALLPRPAKPLRASASHIAHISACRPGARRRASGRSW